MYFQQIMFENNLINPAIEELIKGNEFKIRRKNKMKNKIKCFCILIIMTTTLFTSCQKDVVDKATCDIKTWKQSNYTEWGYHADGKFYHVLSGFVLENVNNITIQDSSFTSEGESFVIIQGITYIDIGGIFFAIEQRIDYGIAEIKYIIDNKSYRDIKCYDIWVEIRFSNNTTEEIIINGTGIQKRSTPEGIFSYDTNGKRIIDITIKDYEFYTNC